MGKRLPLYVVLCTLFVAAAQHAAQGSGSELRTKLEAHIGSHQRAIVSELVDLLSIPNLGSDTENIERNASFLRGMLAKRGLRAEVLETRGNPLVFGELNVPGAKRTILFYAHYDGQPVNPTHWSQSSPFEPILRDRPVEDGGSREIKKLGSLQKFEPEWRLYARGAADDKGPIVALCAALDALKATGSAPTANIKVLLDGELESASPSLIEALPQYREKLTADLLLLLDDPAHPSGRPTVIFGARGGFGLELTTYGPKFGVHSGHFGNWVPNPGIQLARLLASMKDDEGRVLVKGFYDGIQPLGPEEQAMLDTVPDDLEGLKRYFGIAEPERPDLSLQQALQLPSLNIRGLSSAYVGPDARTIIPDTATALLDIRLVKDTPAKGMVEKMLAHIRQQGFHVTESGPDLLTRSRYPHIVRAVIRGGTEAYRTSPLLPESRMVVQAMAKMYGERPVRIRTSGATVPVAASLIAEVGFPAISLPIANFDSNQHGENENVRLGHLFNGVLSLAAVLTMEEVEID